MNLIESAVAIRRNMEFAIRPRAGQCGHGGSIVVDEEDEGLRGDGINLMMNLYLMASN